MNPPKNFTGQTFKEQDRFFSYLSRHRDLSTFILICVLGTLAYLRSFFAGFQFDDYQAIVDNSLIKHFDLAALWLKYKVRLLTNLTFLLNYRLHGLNLFGWHLVSNAIHFTAAFFVYRFAFLTFETPWMKSRWKDSDRHLISILTALIFLLHPIQTQAVTYLSQRATSLCGLFYFGALVFYVQGRLSEKTHYYLWAMIFAFLGIFTKPTAITLPVIIVLYDVVFFGFTRKIAWDKLFLLLFLALLVVIIPVALLGTMGVLDALSLGLNHITPSGYLLTQLNVAVTYIRLLFVPIGQNLDYDYKMAQTLFEYPTLVSFIVLVIIAALAVKLFPKKREWAFAIFWFFITLAPQSSFFPLADVIFEHRLYLAVYGFSFLLCTAGYRLLPSRRAYTACFSGIILILGFLTFERNRLWQDPIVFMEDVARKSPHKARPHNNLGFFYFRDGRLQDAEEEFKKAVASDSNYHLAYYNLAMTYYEQNKFQKAEEVLKDLIRVYPDYAEPYAGLALILGKRGDIQGAFELIQKAIRLDARQASFYVSLGNLSLDKGEAASAKSAFEKAIWLNPDSAFAHYGMGNVHFQEGNFYEALSSYQRAVEIYPSFAQAHNNMGSIFFYFEDHLSAAREYSLAIRFDPSLAEGYFNMANALYAIGEVLDSHRYAAKAAELYRQQGNEAKAKTIEEKLPSANLHW